MDNPNPLLNPRSHLRHRVGVLPVIPRNVNPPSPDTNPDERTTYSGSLEPGQHDNDTQHSRFDPTASDIHEVSAILDSVLVPDLTSTVLELAKYWVRETAERNTQMMIKSADAGRVYVRTKQIGSSTRMVKQESGASTSHENMSQGSTSAQPSLDSLGHVRLVVFTLRSHDQGWSDYRNDWATYRGSNTWFEAKIMRRGSASKNDIAGQEVRETAVASRKIVSNVHASSRDITHTITWSSDAAASSITGNNPQVKQQLQAQQAAFPHQAQQAVQTPAQPPTPGPDEDVEDYTQEERQDIKDWLKQIKPGDRIEVQAFAQYAGWTNHVAGARIDVYYDCDD
jgi:hypothetical protein